MKSITAARHKRSRRRNGQVLIGLSGMLPIAALLVAWEIVGDDSSPYFPPPSSWGSAIRRLWENETLIPAIAHTAWTVLAALAIATAVGVLLGLILGSSPSVRAALQPTLEFIRMIPPPAIIPAAILLLGVTSSMSITVITVAAVWPILLNTVSGIGELSPVLSDVCYSLRLSPTQRMRKVILPAVLPSVLVGVRVAAPIAVVVALLVEMLTNADGLGSLLITAQRTFDASGAFGLLCIVGILGLVINYATVLITTSSARKRGHQQHE